MPPNAKRRAVLTIAGSDSSGGAGLQRDLQVLADHKVEFRSCVTAVTAQGPGGVEAIHPLPPEIVRAQILTAAADECVGAVKIGMLGNHEIVRAVAETLPLLGEIPLVLDPVLASTSNTSLISPEGSTAMRELLCPLARVVTPNLHEAALLLGQQLAISDQEILRQGSTLRDRLASAVLIKGGHTPGKQAVDYLFEGNSTTAISGPRLQAEMRGTGCALSTAIAIQLAGGAELLAACQAAKDYVRSLLAATRS